MLGGALPTFEGTETDAEYFARFAELRRALSDLGPGVDPLEADLLAHTALQEARRLAEHYHLVRPPGLHNILVHMGFKRRGLCHHWADDLLSLFSVLHLRTLRCRWGIAFPTNVLLAHSAVVVTARGAPFRKGLVLDGWRHSGRLYWVAVEEDGYPWKEYR
jgi:hypothetical protein